MAAADSMIRKDKAKGVINSVALERLAKKGLGIWKAHRHCQARGDWEKPGGAKSWKTKVNHELWQRIDPALTGLDEMEFVHRKAEEEIRSQIDRETQILKARSKLAEQKGNATLLSSV